LQAPDVVDHHDTLERARMAVSAASELALEQWKRGPRHWRKADGSPVSEADIAVDRLLHQLLVSGDSDAGWLSEESDDSADRLAHSHVWIADPIDGTRVFLDGGLDWSIALALLAHGRPIVAVVACPARGQIFTASLGNGAFCDGVRLRISDNNNLKAAKIIANRSALARLGKQYEQAFSLPLSLRLCRVAENTFDAALALTPKHDWDLAAGDLIVHESGGRVSDADGKTYRFNGFPPQQQGLIAAGPHLHEEIVNALRVE
jgi:myo-inositol-1(or 4)-monophosphatase